MNEKIFNDYLIIAFLLILAVLSFLIIKPIFISIIIGLLLAYIFNPVYKQISKHVKNKTTSAFILCILIILIIVLPICFFTPIIVKQVIRTYSTIQNLNIELIFRRISPTLFEQFGGDIINIINNFISKNAVLIFEELTNFILDIPKILLQFFIVLVVFFFSLRDQEKFIEYLKSLLPLKKNSTDKFFKQSKSVTNAVVFGQFLTGFIQGVIAGIGFFIFGVNNAILLTILAIFFSLFPIIGPWVVWFPTALILLASGEIVKGLGLMIYGLVIVSWIDNLIRPYIISKTTKISTPIILVGMIGGLFIFGMLGMILGPLILVYLLIVMDFYREKKFSELFFE